VSSAFATLASKGPERFEKMIDWPLRHIHGQGGVIFLLGTDFSFPLLADTSAVQGSYFLVEVSGVMVRGFFQIDVPFHNVS